MPSLSGFSAALHSQGHHLSEFCVASTPTFIECYVQASIPHEPLRVYFTRTPSAVQGLETFACFVSVDGKKAVVKVYGVGEGVRGTEEGEPRIWYLDARFGGAATLEETVRRTVELRIHRCRMNVGTELGIGELLVKDLCWIDQESVFVSFRWYYASQENLSLLGIPLAPQFFASGDGTPSSSPVQNKVPADPLTLRNEFLRRSNDLLVALLTPTQKIEYLSRLITSPETLPFLVDGSKEELEAIKNRLVEKASIDAVIESARAARNEGASNGDTQMEDVIMSDSTKKGGRKAPPTGLVRPDDANLLTIRSPPVRSGSRSPMKLGSPVKGISMGVATRANSGSPAAAAKEKEN